MLQFTKMEGIGNDYVYFDGIHQDVPLTPSFIRKVSAYHTGVGSDGVIVILESETCDFKMRMFNRDGSEGKMCGNGIRCFAKCVYDHHLTKKTELDIETLSGVKHCSLLLAEGKVVQVKVDMGYPSLLCADLPMRYPQDTCQEGAVEIDGRTYYGTAVSMGNPHFVVQVEQLDFEIEQIGPLFEHANYFPEGVNTEFIKIIDRTHISMRVWERGSGETFACGTGACAVMYACYQNGLCDDTVDIMLRGGVLSITYQEGHIVMTGEARTCYIGELEESEYA